MPNFFRFHPEDEDPEKLLDPEEQVSKPWGGAIKGRCDNCGGEGATDHECESCKEGSADADLRGCVLPRAGGQEGARLIHSSRCCGEPLVRRTGRIGSKRNPREEQA